MEMCCCGCEMCLHRTAEGSQSRLKTLSTPMNPLRAPNQRKTHRGLFPCWVAWASGVAFPSLRLPSLSWSKLAANVSTKNSLASSSCALLISSYFVNSRASPAIMQPTLSSDACGFLLRVRRSVCSQFYRPLKGVQPPSSKTPIRRENDKPVLLFGDASSALPFVAI